MASSPKMNLKSALMKRLCGRLAQRPYRGAAGLVLSVSGGADSMVLLDVLLRLAHVHGAPLRVAHIHHGTGAFADASLALVVRVCKVHALELETYYFEGTAGNFEFEAAAFRRKMLNASLRPGEWAVLGHHLQDQSETCVQTLVRGAGIATPLGMAPVHERRLRPLLDIDRQLILEHARAAEVSFLEDPSNNDTANFRNLLRHTVLPPMRATYHKLDDHLAAFAAEWADLRGALENDAWTRFELGFDRAHSFLQRSCLETAPTYLWDFMLRHYWKACGVDTPKRQQAQQLRAWLDRGETGCFDHGGLRFWCDYDGLVLQHAPTQVPRSARFGAPVDWGPWRLLLNLEGGQGEAFTLVPAPALGRRVRDQLRKGSVPLRVRANLPAVQFRGEAYGFCDLFSKAWSRSLRIEVLYPDDVLAQLQLLTADSAVKLETL